MEEILSLQNKYRFVTVASDMATPYKYIPQAIKELMEDLEKIEKIISKNKDGEVYKLCDRMKSKLKTKKLYFEEKIRNIPNKHYMDESDEEWVDRNKPKT